MPKPGKPLKTPDELAIMPGSRCILQLQGVHPFYSRKYDITKHPMYPLLADADEGNQFEVGRYVRSVMAIVKISPFLLLSMWLLNIMILKIFI